MNCKKLPSKFIYSKYLCDFEYSDKDYMKMRSGIKRKIIQAA